MEDTREVSAELHRLADGEPLEPFDTAQLVARGRRGRRRRQLFGAGGAVAGVAMIALGVAVVPNLITTGQQPGVAGQQSPLFEPVPGVPSGENGVDQRISKEEATRRCALRNPEEKRSLEGAGRYRSLHTAMYDMKSGQKPGTCTVPGGDKPKPELVKFAAANPLPAGIPDQLKVCSVQAWSDLTNWKVVADDRSAALGKSILVAVSPSGAKAVSCELSHVKDGQNWVSVGAVSAVTLASADEKTDPVLPGRTGARADMYSAGGGGGSCVDKICTGTSLVGWGRVASAATKVRMSFGASKQYEVPVQDGWFAFTWQVSGSQKVFENAKVVAYDKNDKVVKVISGR